MSIKNVPVGLLAGLLAVSLPGCGKASRSFGNWKSAHGHAERSADLTQLVTERELE
jgi:hypothetical protein